MTKVQSILTGVAMAALLPAAAMAQHAPSQVLNGQVQLNDVIGQMNVVVGSAHGVTASATGVANSMSARSEGTDMNVRSDQIAQGRFGGFTYIQAHEARGVTVGTATGQGNTAVAEVCCAAGDVQMRQVTNPGTVVGAATHMRLGSSDTVVAATQAAGNNVALGASNGYLGSQIQQYNGARVGAHTLVEACCNNDSMTAGAVAAGNTQSIKGYNATVYAGSDQRNFDVIEASSRVVNRSATDVTSAASAAANSIVLDNRWGYAQMDGYQENSAPVRAASEVVLDDWRGSAVSGASAMGNSAILSNIGSDATMMMNQGNYADVSAFAGLQGSSSRGGVGVATSFAVGNAITAGTCASCASGPVKIEGFTNQYNAGAVSAVTMMSVGSAGQLVGSATAIGNSATFSATRGH